MPQLDHLDAWQIKPERARRIMLVLEMGIAPEYVPYYGT